MVFANYWRRTKINCAKSHRYSPRVNISQIQTNRPVLQVIDKLLAIKIFCVVCFDVLPAIELNAAFHFKWRCYKWRSHQREREPLRMGAVTRRGILNKQQYFFAVESEVSLFTGHYLAFDLTPKFCHHHCDHPQGRAPEISGLLYDAVSKFWPCMRVNYALL